jgi:hypothetical protein
MLNNWQGYKPRFRGDDHDQLQDNYGIFRLGDMRRHADAGSVRTRIG